MVKLMKRLLQYRTYSISRYYQLECIVHRVGIFGTISRRFKCINLLCDGSAAYPFYSGFRTPFSWHTERWAEERYTNGDVISYPSLTTSASGTDHNYRMLVVTILILTENNFYINNNYTYLHYHSLQVSYTKRYLCGV